MPDSTRQSAEPGFIEASPGPRGGEGYCLTTRGVSCATRLQAKQQRSAA